MKVKGLFLLIFFFLCSCSPLLQPGFETPVVTLSSFKVLPGSELVPSFEIGLHVVNPNRTALKLQGLSYEVELEGHQVLYGVASQLPAIAAYGEGDVVLQARPDLFSTIRLFTDLMNQPRETFGFNFNAQLDIGSFFPKIRVTESGNISLVAGQGSEL